MIERIEVKFPRWIDGLDKNKLLKKKLLENVKECFSKITK